jgi:hypothetical protein
MKILIQDNYFKNPDSVREFALSIDNYRIDNAFHMPPIGWRGQRSLPLSSLKNKKIDQYEKDIFKVCYDFFDLKNFKYKNVLLPNETPISEFTITSYFHITTEETRSAFLDFWQDRFHKDPDTAVAGVVYLTPNPPSNSGTSILDGEKNQFINVENEYNRLIAYDGSKIHSLSDVFGNCMKTGRLTYTFFIHEIIYTIDE